MEGYLEDATDRVRNAEKVFRFYGDSLGGDCVANAQRQMNTLEEAIYKLRDILR